MVLVLGLLLTTSQFLKMTFMMDYAELLLLLFAQLLRFVIWSLTLKNFMKSGLDLLHQWSGAKLTLKILRLFIYTGTICICGYGIYLICQE